MKITEAERGMLKTGMADETVASIFDRRVSWVRSAREFLRQEAEQDLDRWNRLGTTESGFQESPAQVKPDAEEPHQIDLEEVIAATDRLGAPPELEGRDLASWLYDNSEASFERIAELSGLEVADVQRIADGEEPLPVETDEAYAPRPEIVIFGGSAPSRSAPPAAAPKKPRQVAARQARLPKDAVLAAPQVSIRPAPCAAAAVAVKQIEAEPEEIPARVLKWCRWFLNAHWRLVEVAELFDIAPRDLRAGLGLTTERVQG